MSRHPKFSLARLLGIIVKEFTQMRRDRLTFAMMLGIPMLQLTLFGFAINSDPRALPSELLNIRYQVGSGTIGALDLVIAGVGLVQVIPVVLLFVPAGSLVDRSDRRTLTTLAATAFASAYVMGLPSRPTDS